MKKLLRDYPAREWMEGADGCQYCGAKYEVRVTWVDETGCFGDVEYRISHKEDCPERFDISINGVDMAEGVNVDVAGWEYHDKPFTLRGPHGRGCVELYPLKSRVNVGPCLLCEKLVIRAPLILFIDEGRGEELDFCFGCAEERGILKEMEV